MGLDMNLYVASKEHAEAIFTQGEFDSHFVLEEIGCWRKHANLHGLITSWWEAEYPDSKESFNCIPYALSREQCLEILQRSTGDKPAMDTATGFFWGTSTREDDEYTIGVMHKALEALDEGKVVIYDSWW